MKNVKKTIIIPLVSVIALGIGTIYGLNEAQIEQLEQSLLQGATAIATLTFSDRSLPSSRNVKGDSPMSRWEMNFGWR